MGACAHCGVSVADDQRYCLECGARQLHARSQFLDRFTPATVSASQARVPDERAARPTAGRSTSATALAGVGVLLLAMGVGVLIGRAGAGGTSAAPAQVISVSSPGAGAASAGTPAGAGASSEAGAIPEDWPAGQSGYTVQLQTVSAAGAQASEVDAAKSAAQAKGATAVGVLLSSSFHSLPTGLYVIYSGDYSSEAQAKQALGPLKAKFPAAAAIHVSGGGTSSAGSAGSSSSTPPASGGSSTGGAGKSQAPAASPKSSSPSSGQSFEQKSRNLPNVVTTG